MVLVEIGRMQEASVRGKGGDEPMLQEGWGQYR